MQQYEYVFLLERATSSASLFLFHIDAGGLSVYIHK